MKPEPGVSDNRYDYIMAGGGAAGLSLAYQISRVASRDPRILIIDRDKKEQNDRTWCFWANQATPFDHVVYHIWDQVEFVSDHFQRTYNLAPYRYKMIRGSDFYAAAREALSPQPGVHFLNGLIEEVQDSEEGAQVVVDGKGYLGQYVFDSVFRPSDYANGPAGYHYLKQHFKGWVIETPTDHFNPAVATLFDFRTPQKGTMRFFYILPFNKRRALVEYTLFSYDLLKAHEYDQAISIYLEKVRKIPKYRIDETETGVIPMTDMPFPRQLGNRVMAIGTKGGIVKPSTGYAFLRIQKDSAAIARSLENNAHPFAVPTSHWRYRLFDTLMLQVMYRNGDRMKDIFTRLFKNNSIQDIFNFLDENALFLDNIRVMSSVPSMPFIKAFFKVKLLGRI